MLLPALLAAALLGQTLPRTVSPGDVLEVRVLRIDASTWRELIRRNLVPAPNESTLCFRAEASDAIWTAGEAAGTTFFPPCRVVVPDAGQATASTRATIVDRPDGEPAHVHEEQISFRVTTSRTAPREGTAYIDFRLIQIPRPGPGMPDWPEPGGTTERSPGLRILASEHAMVWTPIGNSRAILRPRGYLMEKPDGSLYVERNPDAKDPASDLSDYTLDPFERDVEITGPMHVVFVTRTTN